MFFVPLEAVGTLCFNASCGNGHLPVSAELPMDALLSFGYVSPCGKGHLPMSVEWLSIVIVFDQKINDVYFGMKIPGFRIFLFW